MDPNDDEKIPFIDEKGAKNVVSNMESGHGSNSEDVSIEMDNISENPHRSQEGLCQDSTLVPSSLNAGGMNENLLNQEIKLCSRPILNFEPPPCLTMVPSFDNDRPQPIKMVPKSGDSPERKSSFKYPIHSAAEKGKVKTLEKLLVKGDPHNFDFKRRTVLHYACAFAYQKKALKMVEIILNSPQAQNTPSEPDRKIKLINFQDKDGETGLHIAARTGHRLVVEKLLFSAADVNLKDKDNVEPLHLIYTKVPAAMIPIFDGAVECQVGDPNDQNLIVRFDFGAIVGYPEPEKEEKLFDLETKLLSYCLQQSEQKRSAVLLHPIVQTFLFLKWKKIRILLWISILYHVIWLLLYTLFILDLYLKQCPYKILHAEKHGHHLDSETTTTPTTSTTLFPPISNETINDDVNETTESIMINDTHNASSSLTTTCEVGLHLLSSLNIELGFLFFVTVSVMLKEIYEIYSTPQIKFYFVQLENVGQWLLIGVVFLTSFPIFLKNEENILVIHAWQYQAAALGIFLAWSLILSQIGKIPRFGIYIEILSKVLRSFTMFMITFASLLVAFMVSFQILMPEKMEFENFPFGFIKVLIMMIGEINYDEMFFSEETNDEIPFPASTKLLYAAFVAVVTIILFNLLIGLTVSDIQGLQNVAVLSSLSSQLEQIYLMEKFIISKKLQRWLLRFNKNQWLRFFLVTQQTEDAATNMGVDLHITKVPTHLQHQVREVARPNIVQEHDDEDDESESNNSISKRSRKDSSSSSSSQSEDGDVVDAALCKAQDSQNQKELKTQIKNILKELLDELREHDAVHCKRNILGFGEED